MKIALVSISTIVQLVAAGIAIKDFVKVLEIIAAIFSKQLKHLFIFRITFMPSLGSSHTTS